MREGASVGHSAMGAKKRNRSDGFFAFLPGFKAVWSSEKL